MAAGLERLSRGFSLRGGGMWRRPAWRVGRAGRGGVGWRLAGLSLAPGSCWEEAGFPSARCRNAVVTACPPEMIAVD